MASWTPLYQELARHVLTFESRQDELIEALRELREQELPVISLTDRDASGREFELREIDPFTFFASFNRGQRLDNRQRILDSLKERWELKAEIPSDFDGIPVVDNRQSWFFRYAADRGPEDVPKLWRLARQSVEKTPADFDPRVLEECLASPYGSLPKLTMGMFWLNPYDYLAIDRLNRDYLTRNGIRFEARSAEAYLKILEDVRAKFDVDFPTISHRAFLEASDKSADEGKKPEIKGGQPDNGANVRRYWWLNANPKIWDFEKVAVGDVQSYTSHNERGNKRQKYKYFGEVKPGDLVVGYVTSPQKEIVAVCEITEGLHDSKEGERIDFKKIEKLRVPISYAELRGNETLARSEPMVNNQGSLFSLSEEEYDLIRAVIDEKNPIVEQAKVPPYSKHQALSELFLSEAELDEVVSRLRRKKNIILQGAPGVGKTFVAMRLAYLMAAAKDPSRVEMVQFHQSYSYEDFIQGYRPNDLGGFSLKPGVFYEFCRTAQRDAARDYFFVIDEINRGNLSKIFGELMMLIEHDKRGAEFAIPLTYASSPDERFYIPENLFIVGTMNTADRSLSLVDYALRRRFAFVTLEPKFSSPRFAETLAAAGASAALVVKIRERMEELNQAIASDDRNLGPGYRVGHSYFCIGPTVGKPDDAWYREVIRSEVAPLLEEYWIDEPDKVEEHVSRLMA